MTPERWTQIEDLFARALALAAHERAQFLQQTCTDPALRREVEALLAEHDTDPNFLETSPWLDPVPLESTDQPQRIGEYRILQSLGQGGMGQVYLAEREAPGFRLRVAIKVMRYGHGPDDRTARFRAERQILANLNHPNIARLFDVGATEQGLPYFVMEYIDGVPILEYCDQRRLGLQERIVLFQSIAAAVQHAHRSLIVHRDLKPQNILVTNEGVAKLLDFGIAKILEPAAGMPVGLTRPGFLMLTPDYAAPEQLLGQPITTACDVYALGVLLYELLVGQHPFRDRVASPLETQRRALESDPAVPSSRVTEETARLRNTTAATLQRQLQGALENIILKAMRRQPDTRYASAQGLAEDLERFAASESARLAHERDRAAALRDFLLDMFSPAGGNSTANEAGMARQVLARRAAAIFHEYPENPELRAEMMYVLAESYRGLGMPAEAEPLARASLDLRRSLPGIRPADVVTSLEQLGRILQQTGQSQEAAALLREAAGPPRQMHGSD
jgi:serine/threonine-protein kinase